VKEYSDDKYTNEKGGVMPPFGIGEMDPAYEKVAFGLQNPGDISSPVETQYGFHILKLIRKIPLQPFDKVQDELTRKVEADNRAKVAKEAYVARVKEKYHFKEFPENLNNLLATFAHDTSSKINIKNYATFQKPLFELENKQYDQYDFLTYVQSITGGSLLGNKITALKNIFSAYENKTLHDLQEAKLYANNEEFRNLVKEYKDGIMLFDLMDKKVWSKASKDSAGLQQFYTQHAAKYKWDPGVEGTIYYSLDQKSLQDFKANLARGMDAQKALDQMDKSKHKATITQESGRYPYTKFPLAPTALKEGEASAIFHNPDSSYAFVFVTKIHPETQPKTLEEARGFVVADYQDYLEQQWNKELKEKYPLKINQKELKRIVKD
jgi:peptidyl-prolyl cis-trans isomerase SurA